MLSLEDLIGRLSGCGQYLFQTPLSLWKGDEKIIFSLGQNYGLQKGFTQKQRDLILKFCKKYRNQLVADLGPDAGKAIDNEYFSMSLIAPVTNNKKVIIEDKTIILQFPYQESVISKIRDFKNKTYANSAQWDADLKVWKFDLHENAIIWIKNNLVDDSWQVDPVFLEYFRQMEDILHNIERYAPCLVEKPEGFEFVNTHKTVPQPETNDLIDALVLANAYGIHIWSENIENRLKETKISPVLEQILRNNGSEALDFDADEYDIDNFQDIIKYFSPLLIIIPGGNEFYSLKKWGYWLKSQNLDPKAISVLFRLPNDSGGMVNSLIKELEFNNPIDENTKIAFVSQKIPKPLIKSGVNFKLAISLGNFYGAHYSIKAYLESISNIVKYNSKNQTGKTVELL